MASGRRLPGGASLVWFELWLHRQDPIDVNVWWDALGEWHAAIRVPEGTFMSHNADIGDALSMAARYIERHRRERSEAARGNTAGAG